MKYLKTFEGLIVSWDTKTVENKIKKLFSSENKEVWILNNKKLLNIQFLNEDMNKDFLEKIYSLINVSGYYIAQYFIVNRKGDNIKHGTIYEDEYLTDKENLTAFVLNKKFDSEIVDLSSLNYLYHVTEEKYLDKIKRQGIKPISRMKIEKHPERIYLFDSEVNAEEFVKDLTKRFNGNYVILKIDVSKLNQTTKFYKDPLFLDDVNAYYIYDNISPLSIIF